MGDFWEKFVSLATMKSPDVDYMMNKKRFRRKRMNNPHSSCEITEWLCININLRHMLQEHQQ